MRSIQPYPVAIALSFIFFIFYSICVLIHLFVPESGWPMAQLWEMVFFGFYWISTLSYFIGGLEIFVAGFYVAYVLIPIYNDLDNRIPRKEGQEMKTLRFTPVALSLSAFGVITYVICIVFDMIFPQWAMYKLWEILLPGFTWISFGSFLVGLLDVIVYGVYIAAIFVPLYNNFSKGELPAVK